MKQGSVTPSPAFYMRLLRSADPVARETAGHFLGLLLQWPDPLARWGTVDYLLHIPIRFYQDALIEKLQEKDQPEEVRALAKRLAANRLGASPKTRVQLLRICALWRMLLYHSAKITYHSTAKDE